MMLINKNNYEKYAEAVVRAITDYKGLKYTPPIETGLYVVKKGDSLWKIANIYGVTVNDLMKVNNLESTLLSIGQELIIPTK